MSDIPSFTRKLADFSSGTRFEDLPEAVVDRTKLVFLDTLICGIAAGDFERSRMMQSVARELGGPGEATVLGLAQRVSAAPAAMANAEIMNLLDADDTFFSSNHFAAFNVAAALASGEKVHASGTELIRATAIGFDVNARVNLSLKWFDLVDGEFQWSSLAGMGFAAIGTAVSAGILLGLDREQMRNLFGLAAWLAPGPATARSPRQAEWWSMKYGAYSGAAMGGMLAAMFAREGYVSDQEILDGEDGFWKTQGSIGTDQDLLVEDLGRKWWIEETSIKYYPSCRYTHAPIDMLRKLMAEERMRPEEIEHIEVRLNPAAFALPLFRSPAERIDGRSHTAPLNGEFNIPYVMALAALGRRPGPAWHRPETYEDPEVLGFMKRVTTAVDPAAQDEVARALREERIGRFRKSRGAITVRARGREHRLETEFCAGDPWTEETRATWDRVGEKLHDFCDGIVSAPALETLAREIRHLEDVKDVSRLLDPLESRESAPGGSGPGTG